MGITTKMVRNSTERQTKGVKMNKVRKLGAFWLVVVMVATVFAVAVKENIAPRWGAINEREGTILPSFINTNNTLISGEGGDKE